MKRKAVPGTTAESTSSDPTDDARSSQTAAEDQSTDRREELAPASSNAHTEESAYTTEKEAVFKNVEKEAVYNRDEGKEVQQDDGKEAHQHFAAELPITTPKSKRNYCGLSKIWLLGVVALIAIIVIALAVALGVVFGTRHSHKPALPMVDSNYSVGGARNPQYFSETGAFNGSGIGLAGEIRSLIQEANGKWTDSATVVSAGRARNGTSISVVAYLKDLTADWHLFYVDVDGFVRQTITSNTSAFSTNIWEDGPLNDLNLKIADTGNNGMQACYWGNFFGDTDYLDGNFTTNTTVSPTGIHVWYADTITSFQQYSYITGQEQWQYDTSFQNQNAQAGLACQTWEGGTTQYIAMLDLDSNINVWWKDSNTSLASTPTHPINQWTKSDIVIPNVHPSTSLGYTNYLAYQGNDGFIRGANISWAAENTTIAPAADGGSGLDTWRIPSPGVPGTHIEVTALSDESGGAYLDVLFQMNGSDISQWAKNDTGGALTQLEEVPVNQ